MKLLLGLLLLAAFVRCVPLFHSMEVIDNQSLVDDTYLSLEIAKNIGLGQGPSYKDGYTSGYQPLYVLLTAPLFIGFDEAAATVADLDAKVRQALVIPILFDLGSLVLLGLLLARQFGWGTATTAGLLLWALHPMVIKTALNGMETSLATFFLLFTLYWYQAKAIRSVHWQPRLLFGFIMGLAVLARIDLVILGFWVLVTELLAVRRQQWSLSQASQSLLITFIGFLLVYSPWWLWSYHYTGDLFPVSGSGVRFQSLILMDGHEGNQSLLWTLASLVATFLYPAVKSPLLFLSLIVLSVMAWRKRRKPQHWSQNFFACFRPWSLLLLFVSTLIFAYGLYIMGWWFYDRYLYCLILIPIIAVAAACHLYLSKQNKRPTKAGHKMLLAVVVFCLIQPRFWSLELGLHSPDFRGYRALGLWLNETLPEGSTVGSMQTGGLGFYATKLKVINLDGVVNKPALDALKSGTIDHYIKQQEMDYLVGWKVNTTALERTSTLGETFTDYLVSLERSTFVTWSFSKWDLFQVNLE